MKKYIIIYAFLGICMALIVISLLSHGNKAEKKELVFLEKYVDENEQWKAQWYNSEIETENKDFTECVQLRIESERVSPYFEKEYWSIEYNDLEYVRKGILNHSSDTLEKVDVVGEENELDIYKIKGISENYVVAVKMSDVEEFCIYAVQPEFYSGMESNFNFPKNVKELFTNIGLYEYKSEVKCYAEIVFYNGDEYSVIHYYIPDGVEFIESRAGECEFYSDMLNGMWEDASLNIVFYHPAVESYFNIQFIQSEKENCLCVESISKRVNYAFFIEEDEVYEIFDYIVSNYNGIRVK